MDAAFTTEQDEIRRTLRELLSTSRGPDEAGYDAGYDPELWRRLVQRLALPGQPLPEAYGAVARGPAGLALAGEEAGRVLLPSSLLATAVLAAPLITALGTGAQRAALLPRIASGGLTAALAVPGGSLSAALGLTEDNASGAWAGGGRAGGVQARRTGSGWRLYGEAGQVLDGHTAGVLVVAAHTGGFARSRTLLFLVRAEAAGLARTQETALDETRPHARIELRDTEADVLGEGEGEGEGESGCGDAVDRARDGARREDADVPGALAAVGRTAAAVLAAEAAGAAAAVLERTIAYVRAGERTADPGVSYRPVEHRLAGLYVQLHAARSAAYYAARDPAEAGGLALAQALEALRATAAEAVQLSGGTGSAREREAQRYFKRAAADELLFGPVHRLRAYAARRAGLFAPSPREEVAV
ncbi:acyl-CoA dehydrogenase family protein [Streptomyces sp. SYSU K217416]